ASGLSAQRRCAANLSRRLSRRRHYASQLWVNVHQCVGMEIGLHSGPAGTSADPPFPSGSLLPIGLGLQRRGATCKSPSLPPARKPSRGASRNRGRRTRMAPSLPPATAGKPSHSAPRNRGRRAGMASPYACRAAHLASTEPDE
ncbi:hypothetical protein EVJ58_g9311, partial [Rhodofomes roseus]